MAPKENGTKRPLTKLSAAKRLKYRPTSLAVYEVKPDARHRIVIKSESDETFRVQHKADGSIVLKPVQIASKDDATTRKARLRLLVSQAQRQGEKVPEGIKLIEFREPNRKEIAYAKSLRGLALRTLAEGRKKSA